MSAVNPLHGPGPMQVKAPATTDQRAYEPSMEEILASIRRIIADDQSLPSRAMAGEEATSAAQGAHAGEQPAPQETHPSQPPHAHQAISAANGSAGSPASITVLHQTAQGRRAEPIEPAGGTEHAPSDDASPAAHDASPAAHDEMHGHGHIAAPQFASPAGPVAPSEDDHDAGDDAAYDLDDHAYDDHAVQEGTDASTLFSTATDRSVTSAFNTLAATRLADNSEDLLGLAREMIRPLLKNWLDDNLPGMVERMVRAEIERVARGGR